MKQDCARYEEVERADRPQFRIMLSGTGEYRFANGTVDPAFAIALIGPTSGRIHGIGTGPMEVVGAGLLPPLWGALMGSRAQQFTDRAIDATSIFGDEAQELARRVAANPDVTARFAMLCDFLGAVDVSADAAPLWFIRIIDDWLAERMDPRIEQLTERTSLSIRQIERLTKRYYGLPPITLARKYRALRAAAVLARGEDLSESGMTDSFYDQSHMIREIKRFAGLTPQKIKAHGSSMLTEIATGRKSLEGKVGPLISDA